MGRDVVEQGDGDRPVCRVCAGADIVVVTGRRRLLGGWSHSAYCAKHAPRDGVAVRPAATWKALHPQLEAAFDRAGRRGS